MRAILAPIQGAIRLSVDCMGGDHGPKVILPACQAFLAQHPQAELILVGRPEALKSAQKWVRCRVVAAEEVVESNDSVEVALRRKKDSSMRVAISLLGSRLRPGDAVPDETLTAHACVSAGNTGALVAVSRYLLKTMEGIDRPAIATLMPQQQGGHTTVLDLGANVDCTAEHLLQFALMGSALVSSLIEGLETPSVGLLNIGEEVIKGNEVIKRAGELLRLAHSQGLINFYGNVEGNDIFKGTTNIVVCDGFVGNVALKTSEGLASMLSQMLRQEFSRNWLTRMAAVAAYPVLQRFKYRLDPRRHNGAAL